MMGDPCRVFFYFFPILQLSLLVCLSLVGTLRANVLCSRTSLELRTSVERTEDDAEYGGGEDEHVADLCCVARVGME